jgi:C-terminal processing protease CtpA/Prc
MKKIFVISLFLIFSGVAKPQPVLLDSLQIERIAKTCQLWGHLKYFHPYTNQNSIDWEKAFTTNIGEIVYARNQSEYETAVQKMLNELHDPATTVIDMPIISESKDTIKSPQISFLEDSILLVSIHNYRSLEDFNYCTEQFMTLCSKIPLSSGVIFDLRNNAVLISELNGWLNYYFPVFEQYLSNQTLTIPGLRTRFHDGFQPEYGSTSGGYSSGTYILGEKKIAPAKGAVNQRIIFIVNKDSEIPKCALALQKTGQGIILSTDSLSDGSFISTFDFDLDSNVQVKLRLDELAIDYRLTADYLLPVGIQESEIMEIARQYLKGNLKSGQKVIAGTIRSEPKIFNSESSIKSAYYPDFEHRLLAIAKIWTIIDYFFAYKELMDDDWNKVLKEFIPRFALASDSLEYNLVVAEMYKHIQDGHGVIESDILSNYYGTAAPPIIIRFIENLPVVVATFNDSIFAVKGIEAGDVILEIDGENISDRIHERTKYLASSNNSALNRYISRKLLNGKDSTFVTLKIQKNNGKVETVILPRYNYFSQYSRDFLKNGRNDLPITRLINKNIGYADLDRLTVDMIDKMFIDFKDTKAIIFDMRGYPNGTAWHIAPHLTNKKKVHAANFRRYSPMNMQIEDDFTENLSIFSQTLPAPKLPYYQGITVMLIDERTQSQSEHTGLFFEAANNTKFIGSQTAGANGDVTNFQIPGNITLYFSGHDVRHSDGRQLQKIGLVPDILVKPTINGIRNGKDEILLKAIEYVESIANK